MDIIFDSFGLYILGLVLLFSSYDIFLRLKHGRKKAGLIFCLIFLLIMGAILFILSMLLLARLYPGFWFVSGVVIFLGTGAGTFQVMKWKRQIINEHRPTKSNERRASEKSRRDYQNRDPQD